MSHIIITDKQVKLANQLGEKGLAVLVEALQMLRDEGIFNQLAISKKYDIGHQRIRTFMKKLKETLNETNL